MASPQSLRSWSVSRVVSLSASAVWPPLSASPRLETKYCGFSMVLVPRVVFLVECQWVTGPAIVVKI